MRWGAAGVIAAAGLAVGMWSAGSVASAPALRRLKGGAIRAAFTGHRLGDGSHFRWRYRADGTIEGKSLGKTIEGRWRVQGDQLCETFDEPETCFYVALQGDSVTLSRDGTSVSISGSLD